MKEKFSKTLILLIVTVIFINTSTSLYAVRRSSAKTRRETTTAPAKTTPKEKLTPKSKAVQSNPAANMYSIGDSLLRAGDTTSAIEKFISIAKKMPNDSLANPAIYKAGNLMLRAGKIDKLNNFLRAIRKKSPEVEILKANIFKKKGQKAKALMKYRDVEILFAGTKWQKIAKDEGDKISSKIRAINLSSGK